MALEEWTPVLPDTELPQGRAVRVSLADVDLFLYRMGDQIFALDNRCTHMGGPLHRGVVKASATQPIVTCPVHGSMFWLSNGRVLRGPATRPQPVYDVRVRDGMV